MAGPQRTKAPAIVLTPAAWLAARSLTRAGVYAKELPHMGWGYHARGVGRAVFKTRDFRTEEDGCGRTAPPASALVPRALVGRVGDTLVPRPSSPVAVPAMPPHLVVVFAL